MRLLLLVLMEILLLLLELEISSGNTILRLGVRNRMELGPVRRRLWLR
jgi:hypothetical protein